MRVHIEQKSLFSYGLDLDKHVRADPPKKIAKMVNLSFMREEACELYGHNGRKSAGLETMLKRIFLLLLDNVKIAHSRRRTRNIKIIIRPRLSKLIRKYH